VLDWKAIYDRVDTIRYMCVGLEKCPTTGRSHVQGWMQFTEKVRITTIVKLVGTNKIHLEAIKGTEEQNEKYCKKDGQVLVYGTGYSVQGCETSLIQIVQEIQESPKLRLNDIMLRWPSEYCRHRNGIRDIKAAVDLKNRRNSLRCYVTVLWGPTTTGKSYTAWHMYEEADTYLIKGDDLRWWNGYQGEKHLVIDEYDSQVKVTTLLGILRRENGGTRLEVKGGETWANWETVVLTSNVDPTEWHSMAKPAHRDALEARINDVVNMNVRFHVD